MFVDNNGVLRKPVAYLADFEMFLPGFPETVKNYNSNVSSYAKRKDFVISNGLLHKINNYLIIILLPLLDIMCNLCNQYNDTVKSA